MSCRQIPFSTVVQSPTSRFLSPPACNTELGHIGGLCQLSRRTSIEDAVPVGRRGHISHVHQCRSAAAAGSGQRAAVVQINISLCTSPGSGLLDKTWDTPAAQPQLPNTHFLHDRRVQINPRRRGTVHHHHSVVQAPCSTSNAPTGSAVARCNDYRYRFLSEGPQVSKSI